MPKSGSAADFECLSVLTQLLANCGQPDTADHGRLLIGEFGSLSALLAATPEAQSRVVGGNMAIVQCLGAVRRAMTHVLKSEITGRSVFSSADSLIAYLKVDLAHATEEHLRVLFLNSRNELLKDEQTFIGSATAVLIRPRPILKRALELGATAVILVHNHPSGDPTPSEDDIRATASLVAAAAPLEIIVHDHIIIGHRTWTSLNTSGLLKRAA